MADRTSGGRGRIAALAASATALLGALLLVWALAGQQPAPPQPPVATGVGSQDDVAETATEGDASQGDASPGTTSPGDTSPDVAQEDEAQEDVVQEDVAQDDASQGDAPPPEALPPSPPVHVDIPGLQVSSPLHALGLAEDGTLQVPSGERYDEAAWYEGSPTPGEVGPTVIEGHVTSSGSTPSVFFGLGALAPGDTVDVAREDGTVVTFEVYATDRFPKDAFPKVAVYGNTAVPELRLITCGGEYDPAARAHVDNVVVFARMVSHT
jgi:Sortase domain